MPRKEEEGSIEKDRRERQHRGGRDIVLSELTLSRWGIEAAVVLVLAGISVA